MKNTIEARVDYETKTIILTKKFAKAAGILGTPEYDSMRQLRKDYPDYAVVLREIKKKDDKKSYKNLSFKAMESYIVLTFGEVSNEHETFGKVMALATCQNSPYAYVKNWFLKNYPNYDSVEEAA